MIHTLGHIHNLEMFIVARNSVYTPSSFTNQHDLLNGLLSTLSFIQNGSYINPVQTDNAVPIIEAIKLLPGTTGILLCLILSIIASTSSEYMRRSFFNLFWYAHQILALLFFILFSAHGVQGVIRRQTNLDQNDPQKCYQIYSDWYQGSRTCDIPQFEGSMATSWAWVILSVLIYIAERFIRLVRGLKRFKILHFKIHPSNVVELQLENTDARYKINYRPGQYVYLNVNKIAALEWHPFTITTAPSDPYLSVHVRCAGDWTNKLQKQLVDKRDDESSIIKYVGVDGPYGTCADDILKYEQVILIGAGIGVTPYASILKDIGHRLSVAGVRSALKLRKVYFFWICSTIDSFEWFGELLQHLEINLREPNASSDDSFLEYKIYLTRGWSLKEAKQIAVNHGDSYDLFTGLQQKTNYGRPNFDLFFKELLASRENKSRSLESGVFFCGPPQLSKELHILCNRYSSENVKFVYNKENF